MRRARTATWFFTRIESSTRLLEALGDDAALRPVAAGGRLRNAGSCYDVVVELDGRTGTTVSERTLDGTATATKCDLPRDVEPCKGQCRFTRKGIDQDTLTALAIDPFGRVVFTGWLNDGRRGRANGFVMRLPEP